MLDAVAREVGVDLDSVSTEAHIVEAESGADSEPQTGDESDPASGDVSESESEDGIESDAAHDTE